MHFLIQIKILINTNFVLHKSTHIYINEKHWLIRLFAKKKLFSKKFKLMTSPSKRKYQAIYFGRQVHRQRQRQRNQSVINYQ